MNEVQRGEQREVHRKAERRIGLARAISKLGYCSRSQAVQFIRAGRVQLNGAVRRDPETPTHERDRISVDGHVIEPGRKIYLAMNKPRNLITTASDEKGRETVYSILAQGGESLPWVTPVGRLDKASEGLLLFTNDSEWAGRVTAPESHLLKTYHVQIGAVAGQELIRAIEGGVEVAGRDVLKAAKCHLLRSGEKNSWLDLTLDEGKNRQIRRILEALGVDVFRLVRVAIGPLQLGKLAKGTYRHLTPEEKFALDRAMSPSHRRSTGATDAC